MAHYVHHLPGRLRLRCGRLKRNAREGAALEARLNRLPGVHDVRINLLTGSLLVNYDPARVDVEALLSQVPAAPVKVRSLARVTPFSALSEQLVNIAVEKAMSRSAHLLLSALL